MDETLERLAAAVVSAAENGGVGNKLRVPTERDLAASLGVNRNTLRERLSALEVLGLLRRTQGSGTYLDMPHPTFVRLYFEMAVKLGHVEVGELQKAREMIERAVVRESAVSATLEDVVALERCVERMLNSTSIEEGDDADYEFHMRLLKASKNPVMELIAEGLSSVLRDLLRQRRYTVRRRPGSFARTNADHVPIIDAIRAGDPEAAEIAIDEHFRIWNEESAKVDNETSNPGKEEVDGDA